MRYEYILQIPKVIWWGAVRSRNCDKQTTEPNSNHLITYKDSFLYPITKYGSTKNIRITLQWLFFMIPNPTNSPQPHDISIKLIKLKDLGIE